MPVPIASTRRALYRWSANRGTTNG
jgi:hypothetical protein